MAITPAQCRAARALIALSRKGLAAAARVTIRTIMDFERGAKDKKGAIRVPRFSTLFTLQSALEKAGVEFIDGNGGGAGVRLK